MSQPLTPFNRQIDRQLLRLISPIVPAVQRTDWHRAWHAELWHLRHRRQPVQRRQLAGISLGILRDALWLRTELWRCTFSGTPTLCLASLTALSLTALLVALAMLGTLREVIAALADPFTHSLEAAPLVLFVALATTFRRHTQRGTTRHWIKRQLFFATKAFLLMLLAFLVSAAAAMPLRHGLPNCFTMGQLFGFVLASLLGLRWACADQERRCKRCLQALTPPARVGRPSRNLLEWNGTEATCKHGHGLLSVPEIETSWCNAARWIAEA
jgi:hypothetical protein